MWTLLALLGCTSSEDGVWTAQERALWSFEGDGRAYTGQALFNLGDLDGDGADELGVATASDDEGASTTLYIMRFRDQGSSLADSWRRVVLPLDSRWLVPRGSCEEPSVPGHSGVVALGDLDGDGLGEFAIAQPDRDQGMVYVFAGATLLARSNAQGGAGVLSLSDAYLTISGREDAWSFGLDMSTGDLDGDGLLELVVGAPVTGTPARAGEVWVLYGSLLAGAQGQVKVNKLGAQVQAWAAGAGMGERVVVTPDLDGDAQMDIVALSPACESEEVGAGLALISGARLNGTAGQSFSVDHSGLLALDRVLPGLGLLSLGDVDGDGAGELALPGWSDGTAEVGIAVFSGAQDLPWTEPLTQFQTGSNSRVQQAVWEPAGVPVLLALDSHYLIQVEAPHRARGWQKLDSLRMPCEAGLVAEQHRIAPGDYDGDGSLEIAVADPNYPCESGTPKGWYGVVDWPEPAALVH